MVRQKKVWVPVVGALSVALVALAYRLRKRHGSTLTTKIRRQKKRLKKVTDSD